LWLLNALAVALLTMLGAAGAALGFDKHLKASTTKRRTHSLFRQGCMHYYLLPTMQEARLQPSWKSSPSSCSSNRFSQISTGIYGLI
jgi:hypothetical protein